MKYFCMVLFLNEVLFSVEIDDILTVILREEDIIFKELNKTRKKRGDILLNNLFLYTHHLSQLTMLVKHEEHSVKQQAIIYYTKNLPRFFQMNLTRAQIKKIYDWRRHQVALMDKLLGKAKDLWSSFVLTFIDHVIWLKDDNKNIRIKEL